MELTLLIKAQIMGLVEGLTEFFQFPAQGI